MFLQERFRFEDGLTCLSIDIYSVVIKPLVQLHVVIEQVDSRFQAILAHKGLRVFAAEDSCPIGL